MWDNEYYFLYFGLDWYLHSTLNPNVVSAVKEADLVILSMGSLYTSIVPNLLNEELIELRKRVKEQEKEIRRLKEENEFLEEASAFFAASRRKSARNKD